MPDQKLWEEFVLSQPSSAKFTDFAGNVRTFHFSGFLTSGYTVVAKEFPNSDRGYEFEATSLSHPQEAMNEVVSKVRVSLATRNLDPHHFPHLLTDRCRGRVANGGAVIDGEFLTWEQVAVMMQAFEGWEFGLQFGDA